MKLQEISVDLIDHPPVEMRDYVAQEHLDALASSIKLAGLLHPIHVIKKGDRYEIISGNCRFMAVQQLGYPTIQCFLDELQTGREAVITVHENLIRQDVSHMETAKFLEHMRTAQSKTPEDLAKMLNRSTTWVYNHLRLLECDAEIKEAVGNGRLNWQAGLELMRIPDPNRRLSLLDSAVRAGASVHVIRQWVASELVAAGYRAPAPPVSPGAAGAEIADMTFICAGCLQKHKQEKMIMVRVDPDCYYNLQGFFKAYRGQGAAPAAEGSADGV